MEIENPDTEVDYDRIGYINGENIWHPLAEYLP